MGDAERAVKLLTTSDAEEAFRIAMILENENRTRKRIDEDTFKDAQQIVNYQFDVSKN